MTQGVDILPGLLKFLCGPPATWEAVQIECKRAKALCYCIDTEMVRLVAPRCGWWTPNSSFARSAGLVIRRKPEWAKHCAVRCQEYEPFFGDFGPLNMGHTYNFCMRTNALLLVLSPLS